MNWDYIIVGAGSTGCALAHELVRSGRSVLVIEAGGWDRALSIKVASGQPRAMAKHDWGYRSQPDPSRQGATENWTRGRVLGGSSSINGTMFVRGTPADFDRWAVPGWSSAEVMPIFQEYERSDQPGPLRGHSGSLHVRTVKRPHPITRAFIHSAGAVGYPFNPDYNGETQEGVAYAQLSQRGGFRCSAADAFLKPLLRRKNLKLRLNALVSKIEISNGCAVAISFHQDGKEHRETARDIILCAGVINSPKLLMLSGVGDPAELERHGIAPMLALPGVGRHLKEHPLVTLNYRSKIPTHNLTEGLLQKLGITAKFLMTGEGPVSNLFEGAAFVRSTTAKPSPDLQIIFMACGFTKGDDGLYRLARVPSVSVHIIASYPLSSGRVRLESRDPDDPPRIECRLLQEQDDVDTLVRGIEVVRKIMSAEPMASLIVEEMSPGAGVQGPSELEEFVRNHTGISYHPMGTCRMGAGAGEDAVVGPDLRVRGMENLWVADASIMPDLISANLNAVCIMIGKKLGKQLQARFY